MIVETARQIQDAGSDLTQYLRVVGVPPSTFGLWARDHAEGKLVPQPPREMTEEERMFRIDLIARMKALGHRRRMTFGLQRLWAEVKDKIRRAEFREIARQVRIEVNRERRGRLLSYEFTHPDVAHSLDFVTFPREFQSGPRRYMFRILDDCTRFTLFKEVTRQKGAGVGSACMHQHLKTGRVPLVMKYDREFAVPGFEQLLLTFKVVPLPSFPASPQTNGKQERANKDVQQWLNFYGNEAFWTDDEIRQELDFCFHELDEVADRAILNERTRAKEYHGRPRPAVDRDAFFRDAVQFRRDLLARPDNKVTPTTAWWVAAKETLKKYGVVRYSGPSELSGDFRG